MIGVSQILPLLSPFKGKRDVIVHDQDVSDIITGILATHERYKPEYDKIAVSFLGFTPIETYRNIWNFIKTNVRYRVEPERTQYLKSPAAIFTPGQTSDCKNMSLATGGILDALRRSGMRIDWCYRFASYRLFDKVPGHVFVVVNPGTNNEIWIDAVLPTFNNKKSYYYKIDKKPTMSLISLAGLDSVGAKKKKAAKAAKPKTTPETKKEKRKKFFQGLKANIKKAGKIVIKYNPATVTSRNAFLALVKTNVRSLATNLQRLMNKPTARQDVIKFWTSIGGKEDILIKNINEGATKKRIGAVMQSKGFMLKTNPATGAKSPVLVKSINPEIVQEIKQNVPPAPTYYQDPNAGGMEEETDESMQDESDESGDGIGVVDPVTQATAALAAATPILIKIAAFLKKHKELITDVADAVGIEKDATDATKAEADTINDVIDKESEGIQTAKGSQIVNNATNTAPQKEVSSKFPIMPVALIGGGILAFMLFKKSK